MDVKEFFYSGGVVACKDRTESDVLIEICESVGILVRYAHDPDSPFHTAAYRRDEDTLAFYAIGHPINGEAVSFQDWHSNIVNPQSIVAVDDLL